MGDAGTPVPAIAVPRLPVEALPLGISVGGVRWVLSCRPYHLGMARFESSGVPSTLPWCLPSIHSSRLCPERGGIASIFECRQSIQHLTGSRSTENRIVLANSSVAEDQHTPGKLRDVMLVSYQHDR